MIKQPIKKNNRPHHTKPFPLDREQKRKPKQKHQDAGVPIIEGLSAIKEYLRYKKTAVQELVCKPAYLAQVTQLLESQKVTHIRPCTLEQYIEKNGKHDIHNLPSQAAVWAVIKVDYLDESSFYARVRSRTHDLIVALDHITDQRNLGSIARTAAFFGVKEMILPKDRQAHVTHGALATAQGAFALCDLILVSNLVQSLEKLKKEGYWIIATDMDGEAFESVAGFYEKVVLVFGSEDKGVSELVRKKSDRMVSIKGGKDALESLNVGVAAGVLIHAFSPKLGR